MSLDTFDMTGKVTPVIGGSKGLGESLQDALPTPDCTHENQERLRRPFPDSPATGANNRSIVEGFR